MPLVTSLIDAPSGLQYQQAGCVDLGARLGDEALDELLVQALHHDHGVPSGGTNTGGRGSAA